MKAPQTGSNLIWLKENKAAHAPSLLVWCWVSHGHAHWRFTPGLERYRFHGGLCGNLPWYVVILTKPTTCLIISAEPNVHNPAEGLAPPTETHPAAAAAANPLWRNRRTWSFSEKANSNAVLPTLYRRHLRTEINGEEGWRILKWRRGRWIPSDGQGRKYVRNKSGRQML